MFDSLRNLSQIGPMMAQAKEMQRKMEEVQARLPQIRAHGSAGGTLVTATSNGLFEIVTLVFSPDAMKTDPELLADLTRAAVNQAIKNAQEKVQQEMQQVTGGVDLGAFRNMLGS
jgi:DNA-binding YbaB/EbfC family protein